MINLTIDTGRRITADSRGKAFQSTAATSNAGTLSFTPLTLAETVDFYQNLIPVQALRVAQADFGDHIYCAGSAFTAPVTIANPWP